MFLFIGKMTEIESQPLMIIATFLTYPTRLLEMLFYGSKAFTLVTAMIVGTVLYHWACLYGLLRLRRWLKNTLQRKTD